MTDTIITKLPALEIAIEQTQRFITTSHNRAEEIKNIITTIHRSYDGVDATAMMHTHQKIQTAATDARTQLAVLQQRIDTAYTHAHKVQHMHTNAWPAR